MHLPSFTRGALAAATLLIGSLAIPLSAGAQTSDVGVTINGSQINLEPEPILQDGRVFVPLRGVFENLGASVVYDAGTITATGNGRDIELHIGSTQATVNGQGETVDVAPFIVGASTYVPLRFVSESLGASVNWDENDRIVAIDMAGVNVQPQQQYQGAPQDNGYDDDQADAPPPPLPSYDQPDVPAPNEIWQPGYWAYGQYGYYWVPGAWVEPPQTGYLWTPGYWGYNNGSYVFNQGYWARSVGFYGGINYGAGYYGNGYVGGQWSGNTFRYNTYVTHANPNVVRNNVYVNRNVSVNNSSTRISFNGGRGVAARPTAQQTQIMHASHIGPTAQQRAHVQVASQNRQFLATVNHNRPPVTAVAQPYSAARRPAGFTPVTTADRVAAPARPATAARPAAARPAAPEARPAAAARPAAPEARPAAAARPAAPEARPAAAARPAAPEARPAAAAARPAAAPAAQFPRASHPALAPAYHAPAAAARPQAVQRPAPVTRPAAAEPAHPAAAARPAPAARPAAPARPAAAPARPAQAPRQTPAEQQPHDDHTPH